MVGVLVAAFAAGSFVASPELRAFAANTVGSADIIDNTIHSVDIKDLEVKTADLAGGVVTSAKIKDGEVKTADLAGSAVNSGKIQDKSVSSADLALSSVKTEHILNGTVLKSDIAPGFMKFVTLSHGQNGWNPGTGLISFMITDADVRASSTILATISFPSGGTPASACSVTIPGQPGFAGFQFSCTVAPLGGSSLNYVVINK